MRAVCKRTAPGPRPTSVRLLSILPRAIRVVVVAAVFAALWPSAQSAILASTSCSDVPWRSRSRQVTSLVEEAPAPGEAAAGPALRVGPVAAAAVEAEAEAVVAAEPLAAPRPQGGRFPSFCVLVEAAEPLAVEAGAVHRVGAAPV